MEPMHNIINNRTGQTIQVPESQLSHYGIYLPTGRQLPSNNIQTLDLIRQSFPQDQIRNAYNIMMLESSGNPYGPPGDTGIIRGIGDISEQYGRPFPSYGPFQIRALPGRPSPQQLYDPRFNIEYAANLYRNQGWYPWYHSARKLGLI